MANPGSEFVVANTLAKWKKLEPNEINFTKVLARKYQQVVSYLTLLPAMFADNLCKQFGQNVGPDLDPNCLTPEWY